MELWIKTQDGDHLYKIDHIGYDDRLGTDNCIVTERYRSYETLGRYSTKERCFKILDEIQNILNADPVPCLVVSGCDIDRNLYEDLNESYKNGDMLTICALDESVKVFEKSAVVYQMPRE